MKLLTLFVAGLLTGALLTRKAKPITIVAEFKLRGKDLVAIGRSQDFRSGTTD